MNFKGKFALVTGGGSGLGAAISRTLGERGAAVFIVGRRHGDLLERQAELERAGIDVTAFPGDISSAESLDGLVEAIRAKTGRLDYLVHSAGVYRKAPIAGMDERDWDEIFDVNVKGIFLLTRMLLPLMNGAGGSILNIASTLAYQTSPGTAAYAASKAAVVSLTRSMAREFSEMNIRVNCICPGIVDTPVHDPFLKNRRERERFIEDISNLVPMGRIGRPGDIASAAAFLLSEDASWITGAVLAVDGGLSLL
jgi:NAD(P)-dependent dehydrogenase (short-subunit alcohol dehydrogenase family)